MNVNKLLPFAAGTLMCVSSLFFSSCNKESKGSFIVKGKLMDSCSAGKPFANKDLILSISVGGASFNIDVHDSIGIGKTDLEGNFNITCENWGRGLLNIKSSGYGTIVSKYPIGSSVSKKKDIEGQIFELGTQCVHE